MRNILARCIVLVNHFRNLVPSNSVGDVWIDAADVSLIQTKIDKFDKLVKDKTMRSSHVTRFYLDTEFDEDGETIELISLGIVCENGNKLYLISNEFDPDHCNEWVKVNVLPNLSKADVIFSQRVVRYSKNEIRDMFLKFVKDNTKARTKPEFWAYYASYDWIVVCQLFGRMIDLPKSMPKFCMDLKQLAVMCNVKLPEQTSVEHNALNDAIWVKERCEELL